MQHWLKVHLCFKNKKVLHFGQTLTSAACRLLYKVFLRNQKRPTELQGSKKMMARVKSVSLKLPDKLALIKDSVIKRNLSLLINIYTHYY